MNALRRCLVAFFLLLPALPVRGADRIEFEQEVLPNGLEVLYAPLRQAPVVHVRVLYHVGSKDERPNRQGFAHMFEHMMFRGSAHVKPEEHMRLVNTVGGYSNAFTSFDQTVYVNTVPANQLEMVLYLEADRMASFRVSEKIFDIERNVVAEEWRRQQNQPYGTVYEDFLRLLFTSHSYRWPVIGNMDHLRAARADELQRFFNTYYIPNNSVLVIAGDFDREATRAMVRKYYGWIPKGPEVKRLSPPEPPQTAPRQEVQGGRVPLPIVLVGYRTPPYRSDDHYALSLLSTILGGGNSSRLDRRLVTNADPLCVGVGARNQALEDAGIFILSGTVMAGKDPAEVEKAIAAVIAESAQRPVSAEELEKARTAERVDFVQSRQTAEKVASVLGQEALIGGDPNRANAVLEKINAVTAADLQAAARKYLTPEKANVLVLRPDPAARERRPATQPTAAENPPATQPIEPRVVEFPEGYPQKAPVASAKLAARFARGEESVINGVKVIVMPDSRLPIVSWNLAMRAGSHTDPEGKEGLADVTADLLRRGAGNLDYDQLNEDLESRGITISVSDAGDHTRLNGSCLTPQLEHAMQRSREILRQPKLSEDEFAKLKLQTLSALQYSEAQPETVASHKLAESLFAGSALGRYATPKSVQSIALADVKGAYERLYRPNDAVLVIAGDVTVERGQALARGLLENWEPAKLPTADYQFATLPAGMRIILVDRPEGKQSLIRMAARAYTVHEDEKYAGALASGILSADIDARLGRYVRVQRGLVYSVWGRFNPDRHAGRFGAGAETKLETTAECIEAIFKVFTDMARDGVTQEELTQEKLRTVGGMVMGMQTIQQQAAYRLEGVLNGYPADYWDRYPERITAVSPSDVGKVAQTYLQPNRFTVVVVAPAAAVKDQLVKLGNVQVVPMPAGAAPRMTRGEPGRQ